MKLFFIICLIASINSTLVGQHLALTFNDAENQGLTIKSLDEIYINAVHSDTTLAVFKSEKNQKEFIDQYIKLLKDLGDFLNENNFNWEKPTKCFNRIYFNEDGTIDYFLFNFLGKAEDKPSELNQIEFNRLLNQFIQDYAIPITAKTKFSQCSPMTFMPKK